MIKGLVSFVDKYHMKLVIVLIIFNLAFMISFGGKEEHLDAQERTLASENKK